MTPMADNKLKVEILGGALYSMLSAVERLNTLCMSLSPGDPFYQRIDSEVCDWKAQLRTWLCGKPTPPPASDEYEINYDGD